MFIILLLSYLHTLEMTIIAVKNIVGLYKFWCGKAFTKESLDRRTIIIDLDDEDDFTLNTSSCRGSLHRTTSFQIAPGSNILVK